MELVPLAADSMGVRSMACLVRSASGRGAVVLDPGAALGPKRFGLPPTGEEERALAEARARIREAARGAQAFTISHFHGDHFPRDGEEAVLEGKTVFMKDPRRRTNPMQRRRGRGSCTRCAIARSWWPATTPCSAWATWS